VVVVPSSDSFSSSSRNPRFLNSRAMIARLLSDISRYGSVPRENLLILAHRRPVFSNSTVKIFYVNAKRSSTAKRSPRATMTFAVNSFTIVGRSRCRRIRSDAALLSISMRRHADLNIPGQSIQSPANRRTLVDNYPMYRTPDLTCAPFTIAAICVSRTYDNLYIYQLLTIRAG